MQLDKRTEATLKGSKSTTESEWDLDQQRYFWTRAKDDNGHFSEIRVRVLPEISAQLMRIVQSRTIAAYQSDADIVRAALHYFLIYELPRAIGEVRDHPADYPELQALKVLLEFQANLERFDREAETVQRLGARMKQATEKKRWNTLRSLLGQAVDLHRQGQHLFLEDTVRDLADLVVTYQKIVEGNHEQT